MVEIAQMVQYRADGFVVRASVLQKRTIRKVVMESSDFIKTLTMEEAIADPNAWYIDSAGELAERQPMSPSQAISEGVLVLSALPDPCEVRVEGQVERVTGGSVTIEFDLPGRYLISLGDSVPFLPQTLEINIP